MKKALILVTCLIVAICISRLFITNVSSTGTLVISMKDPPSGWGQATAVYITYTNIMIHRADAGDESGWFNTGVSVTNLSLREIVIFKTMIGETSLQVGLYNIIRFNITQAIATVNGKNYTCKVKSGKLKVLILRGGVRINPAQISSLEIDITPKITGKDGNFSLKPTAKATPS
jgi:hypothetical protein